MKRLFILLVLLWCMPVVFAAPVIYVGDWSYIVVWEAYGQDYYGTYLYEKKGACVYHNNRTWDVPSEWQGILGASKFVLDYSAAQVSIEVYYYPSGVVDPPPGYVDPSDPVIDPIVTPEDPGGIVITPIDPETPGDLDPWNPENPYNPENPADVVIDPIEQPESPSEPVIVIPEIIYEPPDINIDIDTIPGLDDLSSGIANLIARINAGINSGTNPDDGSSGDDGSGDDEDTTGGNVFVKGMASGVYGAMENVNEAAFQKALNDHNLTAEQISLRIYDVLQGLGISSDEIALKVQQVTDAQGLSDYKIGLAVQDAAFQAGFDGEHIGVYVQDSLQKQHLSAQQIAQELSSAMSALGLNVSGMQYAFQKALQDQDISSGKIQVAFEAAMNNKGLSSENIKTATAQALASQNVSAAAIGREVGNQLVKGGGSTIENDNANTESIVSAIESQSVDFSGVESKLTTVNSSVQSVDANFANIYSGSLTNISSGLINTNFSQVSTNFFSEAVSEMSDQMETVVSTHKTWIDSLFKLEVPDIGKNYTFSIDFDSWFSTSSTSAAAVDSGFSIPSYSVDLSGSAYSNFRALEAFCVYVMTALAAAKIIRDALTE